MVASSASYAIAAPFEYGGTSLAYRIVNELTVAGVEARYRDAADLPNYRNKLVLDEAFSGASKTRGALVLDGVDLVLHERLLSEIVGIGVFSRLIIICRGVSANTLQLDYLPAKQRFEPLVLAASQREDIRTLATQLYQTYDSDLISAAVEKTYNDLLDMCIPLTPANIVMYLEVIYREGSFVALNRIQIMDRYIRGLLQRPGDAYRDAFNVDNKLDVLSGFVYYLHEFGKVEFSRIDWDMYCESEMKRSLSYFNKEELLQDLLVSRVILQNRNFFVFRYKLFYGYMLGRHVAQRPALLELFIKASSHLSVDSLVESIAGSSRDNTLLVTDLIERLDTALLIFENHYKTGSFDPYSEMEWALTEDEKERVWRPVAERLASGPASDQEVDKVKRSILAEQKTDNQTVIIREFSKIEQSVSFSQFQLVHALRESHGLSGDLKVRAIEAIYASFKIMMQIGFLFAPIIATRKFFVWNNVGFYNSMIGDPEYGDDPDYQVRLIADGIPRAITDTATQQIGSKKLGEVFKYYQKTADLNGFPLYLNYTLLIRSKPEGWETAAKAMIASLDKHALYLRYMLQDTMKQFRHEVNITADRIVLKRLVATIQAKRSLNKLNPTAKAVSGVLDKLEKSSYFEEDRNSTSQ